MSSLTEMVLTIGIILCFIYFVVMFAGAASGMVDPSCIHFITPPPEHWSHQNGTVTCN